MTKDGQPYGPIRFKELVKECYAISKNCNTSYTDVLELSVIEKNYLIEFITEEYNRTKEAIESRKQQIN